MKLICDHCGKGKEELSAIHYADFWICNECKKLKYIEVIIFEDEPEYKHILDNYRINKEQNNARNAQSKTKKR